MGFFRNREKDLSVPSDRQINMNPSGKKLEWLESVLLWENEYRNLREKHGWKTVSGNGFRETNDRFAPVTWQLGNTRILATYDSFSGVVTEKIQK